MKNNQLTAVFLALFFFAAAADAWVIIQYNSRLDEAKRLQQNLMGLSVVQMLFNESAEYGKTHPDMTRLLQSTGIGNANKIAPPAAAPTKPAK